MQSYDVIVIGGGMSGASVACELACSTRVLLLERESMPGFHSTGRSAAAFILSYGHEIASLRLLTQASQSFLSNPPPGFCNGEILKRRGLLTVCEPHQVRELEAQYELTRQVFPGQSLIVADAIRRLVPPLSPALSHLALLDSEAYDIDVHTLHDGYLRGLRRAGSTAQSGCEVQQLRFARGQWRVTTPVETFSAPIIVNAAGAWADTIAALAGIRVAGIRPLRRTAVLVDPPRGEVVSSWPVVFDYEGRFYFKPEAGLLLASPADETPSPACDAQPEELDVAYAVSYVEHAFGIEVAHVRRKWAGLRCFAADRVPVIGYDEEATGFFWLAGHGGHGIQIAPAASRLATALISGQRMPRELETLGFDPAMVSPSRSSLMRHAPAGNPDGR